MSHIITIIQRYIPISYHSIGTVYAVHTLSLNTTRIDQSQFVFKLALN